MLRLMFTRSLKLLALLGATILPLSSAPRSSQLPRRLEKCLPNPTLAQEMRDLRPEDPRPVIHVARVRFTGEAHLSLRIRQEIALALKQHSFGEGPGWTDDVRQVVEQILIEHGYFRLNLKIQTHPLNGGSSNHEILITAEGLQYQLEGIQVENAHAFPAHELRALFPLHNGELFNVIKIRKGFDAIKALYGSKGHIDATLEPDTDIDDLHHRISLRIRVNEGPQYRLGRVEILGFNQAITEQLLKSLPKLGQPFDQGLIGNFFKQNKSILPSDVSWEDVNVSRDVKSATVDLVFDFRACPPD